MRILRNLRIDEVSAVVKSANPGAKVMIRKSDGDGPLLFDDIIKALPARDMSGLGDDPGDHGPTADPNDTPTLLHPKLQAMVDAMTIANPSLSAEQHLYTLLHSAAGRRLAEHLSAITKTEKEEPPMDRLEQLKDFAKQQGGMMAMARHVVAKGSTEITEKEFSACLMEHARQNKLNYKETDASAFIRIFEKQQRTEQGLFDRQRLRHARTEKVW